MSGSSYKAEQIFHVCGEKKSKQPAKDQRYRLHNYSQNATEILPF
jgi:hypothetical protein